MREKISDRDIARVIALYNKGISRKEISRMMGMYYPTLCAFVKAREEGFDTPYARRKLLMGEKGISGYEYLSQLAIRNGYLSRQDYLNHLAEKRGDGSEYECMQRRRRKREQNPVNKGLSSLIQKGLLEIGQNISWLAKQLRVSREMSSAYYFGRSIPSKEKLKRLYSVLGIPEKKRPVAI
jgi:hypothetical protein